MNECQERVFYCEREGKQIFAKEFISEKSRKEHLPAIIISHGFGGNLTENEPYCVTLASEGYACYCFDFCGGGREGTGRSEGTSLEMTIESECKDLLAVLHEVQALPYIDSKHINLMGGSQGGFVSALTAAKCKEEIENLILLYPALCIPDDARRGWLGGAVYDVADVPMTLSCPNGMILSHKFHDAVVTMDPFLEIAPFEGRVLLLQGMKDTIVNYSYAIKAKESYKQGQCHLQLIKDAGHGFTKEQTENACIAISQFLKGKTELLTIQVFLTGSKEIEKRENYCKTAVYFTGYCENERFKGAIMSGAVDMQEQEGDGELKLRAEYTLEGIDQKGEPCKLHIVNQRKEGVFQPEITTESKELSYLNDCELTASLESFPGGLTVRIYG